METHRITERMKIILSSELDNFKHFKDVEKMVPEISLEENSKSKLPVKENNQKDENKGMMMNLIGAKRKANQNTGQEFKFVYKFNEGVTNKVNRSLSMNYFFNKN